MKEGFFLQTFHLQGFFLVIFLKSYNKKKKKKNLDRPLLRVAGLQLEEGGSRETRYRVGGEPRVMARSEWEEF